MILQEKREEEKKTIIAEEGRMGNNMEGKKGRSITLVNAAHSKHVVFSNCLHTILIISTPLKCHESAHTTIKIQWGGMLKESDNSLLIS